MTKLWVPCYTPHARLPAIAIVNYISLISWMPRCISSMVIHFGMVRAGGAGCKGGRGWDTSRWRGRVLLLLRLHLIIIPSLPFYSIPSPSFSYLFFLLLSSPFFCFFRLRFTFSPSPSLPCSPFSLLFLIHHHQTTISSSSSFRRSNPVTPAEIWSKSFNISGCKGKLLLWQWEGKLINYRTQVDWSVKLHNIYTHKQLRNRSLE